MQPEGTEREKAERGRSRQESISQSGWPWAGARTGGLLAWILLLALVARLAAVVVLDLVRPPYTGYEPWVPAWSLYHGQGFAFNWYGLLRHVEPSSFLPPLYSWVLYLLLLVTGGNERATLYLVQGMQILLGTLTVYFVARLAEIAAAAGAGAMGPAANRSGDSRATEDRPDSGRPGFPLDRAQAIDDRVQAIDDRLRAIVAHPGLLAAAIWAIYPPALGHVAEARSAVLETFLLSGLAWLILRWWAGASGRPALPARGGTAPWPAGAGPGWRAWSPSAAAQAGALLGLLLLARPNAGLIWAAWFLIFLAQGRRRGQVLRFFFLTGVAAALVVTPWTLRNYRLHHRLIPIATNGGFNFHLGNNPQGTGQIPSLTRFFEEMTDDERETWRRMPEAERDRRLYALGVRYWREHPGRAWKGVAIRLQEFVFFRAFLFDIYPRWLSLTFAASYILLLIPFVLALPRCRGPACTIPLAAIVVTGLLGMAYIVSMRYRATVEPFLAVIGAARGPWPRGGRRSSPSGAERMGAGQGGIGGADRI